MINEFQISLNHEDLDLNKLEYLLISNKLNGSKIISLEYNGKKYEKILNSEPQPLFLFLYHKDDLVTRFNYNQLCRIEGQENIQPISDCQSYLKNTFRVDDGEWPFPHWDSYWMCDGLIYKYILNNKEKVLSRSAIIIIEYDTWWNFSSTKWLNESLKDHDVVGVELLEYEKHPTWDFFQKHSNLSFVKDLVGLRPFSAICCKPESLVKASEYVKNTEELHKVYNNEMRFATACKLSGSKVGVIPYSFKDNIKWHQWGCHTDYPQECIIHPVKNIDQITQNGASLSVVTAAYYNNQNEKKEACDRLQKTLNKFNIELTIFDGPSPSSLQDAKIYKLRKDMDKITSEWTIFADAKDVICISNPILKIDLLKHYNKKILLSAESVCWPEAHLQDKFKDTDHKNTAPNYKYLNSGVILARTKDLIEHLDILISMMEKNPSLKEPWRTDQNIWQYLYLEQERYGASIALDVDSNLSLSTFSIPDEQIEEIYENGEKFAQFSLNLGRPGFLHFNGYDKHDTNRIDGHIKKWLNL